MDHTMWVLVAIIATLLTVAFRSHPRLPTSLRIAIRIGFVTLFTSLVARGLSTERGTERSAAW